MKLFNKNKSIFDKINEHLSKKGHELVMSIFLNNFNGNDIYIRFRVHGMTGAFVCYMSLDENDDYRYGCNFSGKNNEEMHTWDSNDIKEIINNILGIMPHNG